MEFLISSKGAVLMPAAGWFGKVKIILFHSTKFFKQWFTG